MRDNIEDIEVELLLAALYQRYHYDFRHYAKASIKRRLIQACNQLRFASISALQDALCLSAGLPIMAQPVERCGGLYLSYGMTKTKSGAGSRK